MKRILAVLSCLVAFGAEAGYLDMGSFGHSIKLKVAGYSGTETLTNFPVLVRLSEAGIPGFQYSDLTNSKGKDIAFFDAGGNHIASEIETNTWTTSGESLVWVRLPQMKQGTKFFMCYNTSESGVWVTNANPWTEYAGVWHLDEAGVSPKPVFDATTNALNGKICATGKSIGKVSDGMAGVARRIAADNNHDYGIVVDATNGVPQKAAVDLLGTDFSASFWMRWQGTSTYSFLLGRRKGEQGKSWAVRLHSANSKQLEIYAADEKPYSSNYDGTLTKANYASLYTVGTWNKLDIHWRYATNGNQPAADIYLNGVFQETVALPKVPAQADANIGIGCSTQDSPQNANGYKGRRFNGDMDEVRLRPGIVSADWVKAEYDAVADSGFVAVAPPDFLAVDWANDGGVTGLVAVSYAFADVGGKVSSLGGAGSCAIYGKVWAADGEEPADWTLVAESLAGEEAFSGRFSGLAHGTEYVYRLKASTDGEDDVEVSGTFTTMGGGDEGSPYTHLYDDGTNAYWVVNEFERFLGFTVTGYEGTETLTNFPVLVDVRHGDTNGFSYADFYHYDGSDMAFVDENGHIIPHEIDTWNRSGMSLIWVRLPEMNNGTKFTMCYRSPLVDPLPDAGNVFERYVGVWHMNEAEDGVVELKDSTVNNLPGETHANSLAGVNEGQMIGGNCRRVAQEAGTSSSNGRIIVFDHDDIIRTGVGNVFTYSGWYKTADKTPKWAYLVDRKIDDFSRGWGVQYHDSNSETSLRVWSDPEGSKANYQSFDVTGYKHETWAYWTFVFSNDTFHAFLDGKELDSTKGGFALRKPVANDETADYDHLVIGGQQIGTGAFNGWVDEARYSKGVRSDDWIQAEYASTRQKDIPFVAKDAKVSRGTESLVPVVVWRRGPGLPDTIIDVSYAYVQFAGTVTFCGTGAAECDIECQIWADGEESPTNWTTIVSGASAGTAFSVPVTGLKQDMPYNFKIRAVNFVDGVARSNREHVGTFRTHGNVDLTEPEGELLRIDNRFVHRFRAGEYRFTTPDYVTNVEILVVGGGGAGGYKVGGGGGGGGVFHSASYPVGTNTTYRIHVGRGGVAASNLVERSDHGEYSYFALESDQANPLIRVPGGGAGGSYVSDGTIAVGGEGASGGGGTYALAGGEATEDGIYGNAGGMGNDKHVGGSDGKMAAGGGGGAGRAGTDASPDSWYGGGAGGVGLGLSISGRTLYYGAGGGGGYQYKFDAVGGHYTKPGTGGSGVGGDAANLRTGTLATSGIDSTGAGGGGGSMTLNASTPEPSWQGGDGGAGVVMIAYEVHGRDPIAEEPRIAMTDCTYTDENGYADIGYRAYWAGVQTDLDDIYVLYSTKSEADVAAGNGERVKVETDSIGIAMTRFTPPEVGHTYWIRLMARKDANSFTYSDEIAEFEVPAIRLNGYDWHMPKENNPSNDYASIEYELFDMAQDARLYCYWSEDRADLEGDAEPSGGSVRFLDLGTGMQTEKKHPGWFDIPASAGLERNKAYWMRLATGNEAGTRFFLSKLILKIETIDKPRIVFGEAEWKDYVADVDFLATTAYLDPAEVHVLALYSGIEADIKASDPMKVDLINKEGVVVADLGACSGYPDDIETSTQFPMWSPVDTNFYVRLALATNGVPVCYSQRYQTLDLITAVPPNTLLYFVNAAPKTGCYGDAPQALDFTVTYGGRTEGPGWDNRPDIEGSPQCDVTAASPVGQYPISSDTPGVGGAMQLAGGGVPFQNEDEIDPDTGEGTFYYYELVFCGSQYVVTNAVFSASVADVAMPYTGEPCDVGDLVHAEIGVRNGQTVSYLFRVGTNEWTSALPASYTDVGTRTVQFTASAPNHEDATGIFTFTVNPAPLSATISASDLAYTGEAQTPAVTTNVTGLMHGELNPLLCEFRDEAGEWMEDVPTFTAPGGYRLFFRVSAPNHATFETNCAFTISGWDFKVNMDGEAGYGTPINIGIPKWLIDKSGRTGGELADAAVRYGELDKVCPNGLRLWQNYVLEREDFGKKVVATVMQQGRTVKADSFVVHFPNIEPLQTAGLKVRYRLDRKLRGEKKFTEGELSAKYETNVPLANGDPDFDPTGLYVFNMIFSPTNGLLTGQSVISSVATIGVVRVSSPATNTVLAVPWRSMSIDSADVFDVSAANAVNPNGLSGGDMMLAYRPETGRFAGWTHSGGGLWEGIASVATNGVKVEDADVATFPRGGAYWLVRSDPGGYIYLVGRYTGEAVAVELAGGTTAAPGSTLCGNPAMEPVALNDLAFVDEDGNPAKPAPDDRISVQGASGLQTVYFRNKANTRWGRNATMSDRGRIRKVWTEDGSIPAGTGFWYIRTAEAPLYIKFEAEE